MFNRIKETLRRWVNNIPFYVPWSVEICLRFEDGRDHYVTVVTTPDFISHEGRIFQPDPRDCYTYYEIVPTPLDSIDRDLLKIKHDEEMHREAEKFVFARNPTAEDLRRLKAYFESDRDVNFQIVDESNTVVYHTVCDDMTLGEMQGTFAEIEPKPTMYD
jgi:hypothetical protein